MFNTNNSTEIDIWTANKNGEFQRIFPLIFSVYFDCSGATTLSDGHTWSGTSAHTFSCTVGDIYILVTRWDVAVAATDIVISSGGQELAFIAPTATNGYYFGFKLVQATASSMTVSITKNSGLCAVKISWQLFY